MELTMSEMREKAIELGFTQNQAKEIAQQWVIYTNLARVVMVPLRVSGADSRIFGALQEFQGRCQDIYNSDSQNPLRLVAGLEDQNGDDIYGFVTEYVGSHGGPCVCYVDPNWIYPVSDLFLQEMEDKMKGTEYFEKYGREALIAACEQQFDADMSDDQHLVVELIADDTAVCSWVADSMGNHVAYVDQYLELDDIDLDEPGEMPKEKPITAQNLFGKIESKNLKNLLHKPEKSVEQMTQSELSDYAEKLGSMPETGTEKYYLIDDDYYGDSAVMTRSELDNFAAWTRQNNPEANDPHAVAIEGCQVLDLYRFEIPILIGDGSYKYIPHYYRASGEYAGCID